MAAYNFRKSNIITRMSSQKSKAPKRSSSLLSVRSYTSDSSSHISVRSESYISVNSDTESTSDTSSRLSVRSINSDLSQLSMGSENRSTVSSFLSVNTSSSAAKESTRHQNSKMKFSKDQAKRPNFTENVKYQTSDISLTTFDLSNTCTEKCKEHPNNVKTNIYTRHGSLGCSDCTALEHSTCKTDNIHDIFNGVLNSREFIDTFQEIPQKIKTAEEIAKAANEVKAKNIESVSNSIKEIELFQKSIYEKLEHLKLQMIDEATTYVSSEDKVIDRIAETSTAMAKELKVIYSTLEDSLSERNEAKVYTAIEQAQIKIKSLDWKAQSEILVMHELTHVFEPNIDLERSLSVPECLGKLFIRTKQVKQNVDNLTHETSINVKTKSDKQKCDITGCAAAFRDSLLLADWNNKKIKVVDIPRRKVIEEITLDSQPFDIVVLPDNHIGVTLPAENEILIYRKVGQMLTVSVINVERFCFGITYHTNCLFVVCREPLSVLVFDMHGQVHRDISLVSIPGLSFSYPQYITATNDELYVSDFDSKIVVKLTLKGDVSDASVNKSITAPQGLTVTDDGHLLVCCWEPGCLLRVTSDLKEIFVNAENIHENLQSICYQPESGQYYIGSAECDHIKVFVAADYSSVDKDK